jgi:putative ABC transport system permease protein
MFENIRLAFQGILAHKMRSLLTMLGIIIGIGSIIAIVSTIQGTNDQLREQLIGSGNNTVKVTLGSGGESYDMEMSSSLAGIHPVSDATVERILALDTVDRVTCYTNRVLWETAVYYKDRSLTTSNISGVDDQYFDTLGYRVRTGREFLQSDYDHFAKVVVLDQTASDSLFKGEDPLGKTIEIYKNPFTVVGVVYEPSTFESNIEDIEDYQLMNDVEATGMIFIPKASWPILFKYDEPENVIVKASDTDAMTKAGQRTAKILNSTITVENPTVTYEAEDLLGDLKNKQKMQNATNIQLMWIAGISLLVGGIGVMNIMLVSVTERTSEIGLKKAIGARKSSILWQFLTEASVLTSLGGLLGVAAGVVMARIINIATGIPVGINWLAAIIAVFFSMGIGIIFGLIPSIQASNLDPIDALRRE